jgi:hypothetical protein
MDAVRRAVATSEQVNTGVSKSRKWAVTNGVITVETSFVTDVGIVCTALTIDVEGSITGNFWFALASHSFTAAELTAQACMFHIVDKPIVWIRTNITTLTQTGLGNVSVTVDLLSYD